MIDYAYKSQVLKSGLCEIQRDVSIAINKDFYKLNVPFKVYYDGQTACQIMDACRSSYGLKAWNEAEKINYATYKRVKRLSDRIQQMLSSGTCLFLTLTFTDNVLFNTSQETRCRYVKRFLKSLNTTYIANIDFGKENGREHYHAIVRLDKISDTQRQVYNKLCGAINFEKIHKSSNAKALAKYCAKLTNHAIKETTKRNAIIYSR